MLYEVITNNQNRAKFADTAVDTLLDNMIKLGADRKRITAKLAGGAQMFSFSSSSDIIRVGERNILASRAKLISLNIPIIVITSYSIHYTKLYDTPSPNILSFY